MTEKINYDEIIKKYPWIVKENQDCILSPDIDGILCGLFTSHYLGWNIKGFYDGKYLLLDNTKKAKECIFLDMEILRNDIRSVGHHLNIHMLNNPPADYHEKMSNCLNPNLIRGFDRRKGTLGRKYPLGAIHLLMYILENHSPGTTRVKAEGLAPIFFADGVWKILFKYTGNVLDWFKYLHSGKEADWWTKLSKLSVIDLIELIDSFLISLKEINLTAYGHLELSNFDKGALLKTLGLLSNLTGWSIKMEHWNTEKFKLSQFTKKIYGQNLTGKTSNDMFLKIWGENPISLAMTDGSTIQYTIEGPDMLN